MSNDISSVLDESDDDNEAARKSLLMAGLKARLARGQARVTAPKTEDPDPLGFLGSSVAAPVPVAASIDAFSHGRTNQREHLELLLATERDRSKSVADEAKFQAARLEFLIFKMRGEAASDAQILVFDRYLSMYLNRGFAGGGTANTAAGGSVGDPRSGGGNAHRSTMERPRG